MSRNCRNGLKCFNEDCIFNHPPNWRVCNVNCENYFCSYAHPPSRKGPCRNRESCYDQNCAFLHPNNRKFCYYGESCLDYYCNYVHSPSRRKPCLSGSKCYKYECEFLHPPSRILCSETCVLFECSNVHPKTRKRDCLSKGECHNYECEYLHPPNRFLCNSTCILAECTGAHPVTRKRACLSKEQCFKYDCEYLHPINRKEPCQNREDCKDFKCNKSHPLSRTGTCALGKRCFNFNCKLLHPDCPLGVDCIIFDCEDRHPFGRRKICPRNGECPSKACEFLHPDNWKPETKKLKTQHDRNVFRNKNQLPIFKSKDLFIERLKSDKVLIVTAETGAGKTTQLAQYAAENFEGKVICTQPRELAAITIAERIADEFDGSGPGENVGYIFGGKVLSGKRIEIMTDLHLVNRLLHNPQLSDVSVLIIDEAHERSLYTDLVLGIAKLILQERPNDFYVVITSATIDPTPFLDFFFTSKKLVPLQIPSGRTFPVTVENVEILVDEETPNFNSSLISEVVNVLNKYNEGNCLVFLPSSKEVDLAIKEFNKKKQDNWIPFPLYESLAPEEQALVMSFGDQDPKSRMIVFCTNIAETSLTIPDVRVVIDTGLAKEARYDPKHRITVLEQVFISKASADQRRGRAGRTAPGNCIRLYSEQKLTQVNIEPEILRSSLDLVVLQLKNLNYDPLNFPFLSAPKREFLQSSIQLLTQFECLDSKQQITKRGKLFSDFPFDPKLSNFIITAQEQFGQGEAAIQIVSIITTPGSIFFMGTAKDRNENKKRVATASSEFNSDLLFLLSTYRNWLDAGKTVDNKCQTCFDFINESEDVGCSSCRSKFAAQNGLNNKIAELIRSTELKVERKARFNPTKIVSSNLLEVIGHCLLSSFKEQICENLIADNPDAGVLILKSGGKGTFSTTSSFAQKSKSEFRYFIAMSITQISKDLLIIDQCHPIHTDWIPKDLSQKLKDSSLQVKECYSKPNVNNSFRKYVCEALQNSGDQYSKFTLVLYDYARTTLRVFGPSDIAKEINNICGKAVLNKLKQEFEKETTCDVFNGKLIASINAGLKITNVQSPKDLNQVRFIKPPVKNSQELREWICEKTGIPDSSIKSCVYYSKASKDSFGSLDDAESYGVVDFQFSEQAKLASIINNQNEEASFGKKVYWKLTKRISKEEAEFILHKNHFFPLIPSSSSTFKINIVNLGSDNIAQKLKNLNLNYVGEIKLSKNINSGATTAGIFFNSEQDRNSAIQIFSNSPLSKESIKIQTKYGSSKTVSPIVNIRDKPSEFLLEFKTIQEAEDFLKKFQYSDTETLECRAAVKVFYPQLYELDRIGKQIAKNFGVEYTGEKLKKNTSSIHVIFAGKEAKKCNQAAQAFSSSISPLYIRLATRKQQLMITELNDLGLIDQYASELNLKIELLADPKTNLYRKMKIFGSKVSQGTLMSKIGDYTETFESRYDVIHLSLENRILFRNQREGAVFLKQLSDSKAAKIQYISYENGIEIYLSPNANDSIQTYKKKIIEFLQTKGSANTIEISKCCVFCGKKGGLSFTICGHYYCPECLNSNCPYLIQAENEISCRKCNTPISVIDLKSSLSMETLRKQVELGVNQFLRNSPNHSFTICPGEYCNAIKRKDHVYSLCLACGLDSCALCGTIQNDLHKNRTCQEFKDISKFNVERIIQGAKEFVKTKWDVQVGTLKEVYENPGLRCGCPAIQKFCKGLENCEIQNSFYAWHGTGTQEAIKGICHEGWDPKRRTGQVYGRGEYFGQSASISAGYSGRLGNMIVALLLKVPQVSTHSNFCYVVDNPLDWKVAFNLPVLVLTYNQGKPPQFESMKTNQPLNLNFLNQSKGNDDSSDWKCCFRWHWQKDDSQFEPYSDNVNSILENHYSMYQCGQASPQFETQPITRYVDDRPQVYKIDFDKNIQINVSTGYLRQIKRKKMDLLPPFGQWQVQDENGNWKNYESLVQSTIETQYQTYIKGSGPGKIKLQFPGRPELYSLNFVDGIQTNPQSSTKRRIRKH